MLNVEQPYIIIPKIDIPYTYIPYNKNVETYIKDYNVAEPFYIEKEKLREIEYISKCTILLFHVNKYYWCPLLEDLYKSYSKPFSRYKFMCTVSVREEKDKVIVHFSIKKKEYRVTEVKRIICK